MSPRRRRRSPRNGGPSVPASPKQSGRRRVSMSRRRGPREALNAAAVLPAARRPFTDGINHGPRGGRGGLIRRGSGQCPSAPCSDRPGALRACGFYWERDPGNWCCCVLTAWGTRPRSCAGVPRRGRLLGQVVEPGGLAGSGVRRTSVNEKCRSPNDDGSLLHGGMFATCNLPINACRAAPLVLARHA